MVHNVCEKLPINKAKKVWIHCGRFWRGDTLLPCFVSQCGLNSCAMGQVSAIAQFSWFLERKSLDLYSSNVCTVLPWKQPVAFLKCATLNAF